MPNIRGFLRQDFQEFLQVSLGNRKSGKITRGANSDLGKVSGKGGGRGGGGGGADVAVIPLCLKKVLKGKCFISLMEMWVAGRGQKKRPGVRNNYYIGRRSPLECNGIIKIYLENIAIK